jgi:hypothetical protein
MKGKTMFDSSSIAAAELLSMFGKNTCVTLTHNYGANNIEVRSARTNNVIAEVILDSSLAYEYVDYSTNGTTITAHPMHMQEVAECIKAMRKFPKNRKMAKAWSPIRLTAKAQADAEITRQTALNWG